jgi:hypothetical protein
MHIKAIENLKLYLLHSGFISEAVQINSLIKNANDNSIESLEVFEGFDDPTENGIKLNGKFYSILDMKEGAEIPKVLEDLINSDPELETFKKHLNKNSEE